MSNVIKSRYVYLNDDEKKFIDTNDKTQAILKNHLKQILNKQVDQESLMANESDLDGFVEGLPVTIVEHVSSKEEEESILAQKDEIISEAQRQAQEIIDEAKESAKKTCEDLYEESRKQGYEDGLNEAKSVIEQEKQQLQEQKESQTQQYIEQVNSLETDFANIVMALVEKLTGIVVEDKKDVILYLIHNAILGADNSKSYIIRVSKDDYEFVKSKQDELKSLLSENAILEITLDKSLSKNQCLIEIDTCIIDCSLDVQLSNLIEDLKILAN